MFLLIIQRDSSKIPWPTLELKESMRSKSGIAGRGGAKFKPRWNPSLPGANLVDLDEKTSQIGLRFGEGCGSGNLWLEFSASFSMAASVEVN